MNDGRKLFGVSSAKSGLTTANNLPLSLSERGAHERSECAGYARGGRAGHHGPSSQIMGITVQKTSGKEFKYGDDEPASG